MASSPNYISTRGLCRLQMRGLRDDEFMNALCFSGSYMVMMNEVGQQACRVKKRRACCRTHVRPLSSRQGVSPLLSTHAFPPLKLRETEAAAFLAHVLQINAYQDKGRRFWHEKWAGEGSALVGPIREV